MQCKMDTAVVSSVTYLSYFTWQSFKQLITLYEKGLDKNPREKNTIRANLYDTWFVENNFFP